MNTTVFSSPISETASAEPIGDAAVWSCKRDGCTARVLTSWRLIDAKLWRTLIAAQCWDCRYYEVAEQTLSGQFDHRYFVLKNERTGAMAVQPFFFVDQDLLAGLPSRVRKALAALRKFWPRFLILRMLMVGCTAGEGHPGCEEPWAVNALRKALDEYAGHENAGVILLKDFPARYRELLRAFTTNGYTCAPSMPGARMEIDFADFEEYMRTKLSKIFRKNLRRKFKQSAGLGTLTMEIVNDVTPYADEVHALYLQTHGRSEFQFEHLTKEYFCALGRRMPESVRYFLWRLEGRIVAFSLCMVHGETIHDMNVGMDYAVALDLHLYFTTFRDIIQWAAGHGLKHYSTGPLNYDPKLHLRLDLDPLDLYARHTSRFINPFFKIALRYLQPARHDPVIRQFRNAHELY